MEEEEEEDQGTRSGSTLPPGFRFHPTEEELIHFYLRRKISTSGATGSGSFEFDSVIPEVQLNELEPWDIQGSK
jgi:hypothetical protein